MAMGGEGAGANKDNIGINVGDIHNRAIGNNDSMKPSI
jgi:hypothetical protein